MARIAVFNQKGGVGKTTTVLNLAAALTIKKKPPLVIDLDPQGHLTNIYTHAAVSSNQSIFEFYKENMPLTELFQPWQNIGTLIPSHKELIKVDSIYGKGPAILNRLNSGLNALENQSTFPKSQHTLIDCCPYIGVLSLNAIFAADLIIIPIASDFMSLQAAKKVEHTLRALEPVLKRRIPKRYLLTCYDKRRGMTFEVEKTARESFGKEVLKTVISVNVAIAESPQYQKDIFSFSASSTGAEHYAALLKELTRQKII